MADQISDNELMQARTELQQARQKSSPRPPNRMQPKAALKQIPMKYTPFLLKQQDEIQNLAQSNTFSHKAQQSIAIAQSTNVVQIQNNQKTPFQSVGNDAVYLYVSAAAQALQQIELIDPTVAQTVQKTIDFLTQENRLNPIQMQKVYKQNDELKMQIEQNQKQIQDLKQLLQLAHDECQNVQEQQQVEQTIANAYQHESEMVRQEMNQFCNQQVQMMKECQAAEQLKQEAHQDSVKLAEHANNLTLQLNRIRTEYETIIKDKILLDKNFDKARNEISKYKEEADISIATIAKYEKEVKFSEMQIQQLKDKLSDSQQQSRQMVQKSKQKQDQLERNIQILKEQAENGDFQLKSGETWHEKLQRIQKETEMEVQSKFVVQTDNLGIQVEQMAFKKGDDEVFQANDYSETSFDYKIPEESGQEIDENRKYVSRRRFTKELIAKQQMLEKYHKYKCKFLEQEKLCTLDDKTIIEIQQKYESQIKDLKNEVMCSSILQKEQITAIEQLFEKKEKTQLLENFKQNEIQQNQKTLKKKLEHNSSSKNEVQAKKTSRQQQKSSTQLLKSGRVSQQAIQVQQSSRNMHTMKDKILVDTNMNQVQQNATLDQNTQISNNNSKVGRDIIPTSRIVKHQPSTNQVQQQNEQQNENTSNQAIVQPLEQLDPDPNEYQNENEGEEQYVDEVENIADNEEEQENDDIRVPHQSLQDVSYIANTKEIQTENIEIEKQIQEKNIEKSEQNEQKAETKSENILKIEQKDQEIQCCAIQKDMHTQATSCILQLNMCQKCKNILQQDEDQQIVGDKLQQNVIFDDDLYLNSSLIQQVHNQQQLDQHTQEQQIDENHQSNVEQFISVRDRMIENYENLLLVLQRINELQYNRFQKPRVQTLEDRYNEEQLQKDKDVMLNDAQNLKKQFILLQNTYEQLLQRPRNKETDAINCQETKQDVNQNLGQLIKVKPIASSPSPKFLDVGDFQMPKQLLDPSKLQDYIKNLQENILLQPIKECLTINNMQKNDDETEQIKDKQTDIANTDQQNQQKQQTVLAPKEQNELMKVVTQNCDSKQSRVVKLVNQQPIKNQHIATNRIAIVKQKLDYKITTQQIKANSNMRKNNISYLSIHSAFSDHPTIGLFQNYFFPMQISTNLELQKKISGLPPIFIPQRIHMLREINCFELIELGNNMKFLYNNEEQTNNEMEIKVNLEVQFCLHKNKYEQFFEDMKNYVSTIEILKIGNYQYIELPSNVIVKPCSWINMICGQIISNKKAIHAKSMMNIVKEYCNVNKIQHQEFNQFLYQLFINCIFWSDVDEEVKLFHDFFTLQIDFKHFYFVFYLQQELLKELGDLHQKITEQQLLNIRSRYQVNIVGVTGFEAIRIFLNKYLKQFRSISQISYDMIMNKMSDDMIRASDALEIFQKTQLPCHTQYEEFAKNLENTYGDWISEQQFWKIVYGLNMQHFIINAKAYCQDYLHILLQLVNDNRDKFNAKQINLLLQNCELQLQQSDSLQIYCAFEALREAIVIGMYDENQ